MLWTNLLNFCASLLYHIIVANVAVSETSGCAPVYSVIWASWLPVFNLWALDTSGFQAGSTVCIQSVSLEKTTCHLVEDVDVQSANIGIHSAWRKADNHTLWWGIFNQANSPYRGTPLKRTVNVGCILCYLLLLYTTEILEYNYFVEH